MSTAFVFLAEGFEEIEAVTIVDVLRRAGTKNLAAHAGVTEVLREYAASGKYIAAICAAPSVPGQMGLLNGKKAACYPGFEETLRGAEVTDGPVVVDGTFVTSRGPATAMAFALRLAELLAGENATCEVADGMLYKTYS
jgi:4-methyl-5(b-hydroxyethyl)-thiazole monophosphate biosynthesis